MAMPSSGRDRSRGMTTKPVFGLAVKRDDSFLESCLSRTLALASKHKRRILPELAGTDSTWPFADRVLVWLADHWRNDVERYHRKGTPSLAELLKEHQLEHLDEHYRNELRARLKHRGPSV